MPSLEQIIRPFVVDPTTPPIPYITTNNEPEPEPVRLSIGIGGTRLKDLSPDVAPDIPPGQESDSLSKPKISMQQTSSSYSISLTFYLTEHVNEQKQQQQG
jgi:hypothetical protein